MFYLEFYRLEQSTLYWQRAETEWKTKTTRLQLRATLSFNQNQL